MFGLRFNLLFSILVLFIGIVISFYVFQFGRYTLSDNLEAWGQTGDYFGGLLNPLISLLNLVVTIFIARQVHTLTVEQSTRQVDSQKIILRRQLQYDIMKQFNTDFEMRMASIESEMSQSEALSYEKIVSSIDDLDDLMQSFANGGSNIFRNLGSAKGLEIWTALRTLISHWKKRENLVNKQYCYKVRGQKSLMLRDLYSEIID